MATIKEPFSIKKDLFFFVPALPSSIESAAAVREAFLFLQPEAVAVALPEVLNEWHIRAAARLPDLSLIEYKNALTLIEPCDPFIEGVRSAIEHGSTALSIAPLAYRVQHALPDPYAIHEIGLEKYYLAYQDNTPSIQMTDRHLFMAKKLRELSFRYDRILVVIDIEDVSNVLLALGHSSYPEFHLEKDSVHFFTTNEESSREIVHATGWMTGQYELFRKNRNHDLIDRKKQAMALIKAAKKNYLASGYNTFSQKNLDTLFIFARRLAHQKGLLLPELYDLLTASRGCFDHNFAYEVWKLATEYSFLRNIDNLEERPVTLQELSSYSKKIRFHLKKPSEKRLFTERLKKTNLQEKFSPPGPFTLCSWPKEDIIIEQLGDFLKKKGEQKGTPQHTHSIPFSNSLEDGIDIRETLRHWYEKKIYVKKEMRSKTKVSSCVIVFDTEQEKYPWRLTWIGENTQESDMAFYATSLNETIIGPGISRCLYGGLMLSYPPRRLFNVWSDPDYPPEIPPHEILLLAAIDYSITNAIVYVAEKSPSHHMKKYASRRDRKILFIPLNQIPKHLQKKIRYFHVLDGHHKRLIADEYIY